MVDADGDGNDLELTTPDGSTAWKGRKTQTISSPFKRVMGGGGHHVHRCRNVSSSAARHTPRAARRRCSSRLVCIAGEWVGWDAWRGGVADVLMRCRAVHISLSCQTDIDQQDWVVRCGKRHTHVGPKTIQAGPAKATCRFVPGAQRPGSLELLQDNSNMSQIHSKMSQQVAVIKKLPDFI
jgi:hypothetical protein